jgi:hypothetical protein
MVELPSGKCNSIEQSTSSEATSVATDAENPVFLNLRFYQVVLKEIKIFWNVRLYPDVGNKIILRNIGNYLPVYTA